MGSHRAKRSLIAHRQLCPNGPSQLSDLVHALEPVEFAPELAKSLVKGDALPMVVPIVHLIPQQAVEMWRGQVKSVAASAMTSQRDPRFPRASPAQVREQRLGFLEVRRVKPLGEPLQDCSQQLPRFGPFAPAPP
jgi:hypothetical protein